MMIMMKIAMVIVMIVKISKHLTSTFYGPGTVLSDLQLHSGPFTGCVSAVIPILGMRKEKHREVKYLLLRLGPVQDSKPRTMACQPGGRAQKRLQ